MNRALILVAGATLVALALACEPIPQPPVVTPTPTAEAATTTAVAVATPTGDPAGTMPAQDEQARSYYENAVTFQKVGDYGEARKMCRKVIKDYQPDPGQAYHAKCRELLKGIDATLKAKGLR